MLVTCSLKTIFGAAQRVNKWQLVHGNNSRSKCHSERGFATDQRRAVPPPPAMISAEATCVLVGDCCHSFHPFLTQGLNLGLEDAATLGHLLSRVGSSNQLPKALALYNRLRTDRARKLLDETCVQVEKLHQPVDELQKHSQEELTGNLGVLHDR